MATNVGCGKTARGLLEGQLSRLRGDLAHRRNRVLRKRPTGCAVHLVTGPETGDAGADRLPRQWRPWGYLEVGPFVSDRP